MISLIGGSSILLRARFKIESPNKFWSKSSSLVTRCSSLEPPNVSQLADTARITLSPKEIQDFAPKINKVIDWFGQLQGVDLESIEPSLRADTDASTKPREDISETFENREAILAEIPSFTEPYIKVPKVLNKE